MKVLHDLTVDEAAQYRHLGWHVEVSSTYNQDHRLDTFTATWHGSGEPPMPVIKFTNLYHDEMARYCKVGWTRTESYRDPMTMDILYNVEWKGEGDAVYPQEARAVHVEESPDEAVEMEYYGVLVGDDIVSLYSERPSIVTLTLKAKIV